MATAYTTYSRDAKKTIQYQFTCEHCGKENLMKSFTLTGSASKNVSGKGALSQADQVMLQQQAAGNLQSTIQAKKGYVEKGRYGQEISGKCDSCGKRQSWEMKSAKLLPLWGSLQGLAIGFLIVIFASVFGNKVGNAATVCIPIGFVGGLIVGFVQLVKMKANTSSAAESKPTIFW